VPIHLSLVMTSLLFGLWHVPGAFHLPPLVAAVKLGYTGILSVIPGLSRQWTGSIYYATASHMVVNFITWSFAPSE
jgi:membrane protease YdiL (CAAX protease family)